MASAAEPTVSVSLTVKDTAQALEFYARAFGARELLRITAPDGTIAHAEFMIGSTRIYISDEAADWHAFAPPPGAMAPCLFSVATQDCDQAHRQAVAAGATSLRSPQDQFWGVRSSIIKDPFGYRWALNQRIEVLTPDELARRAAALFARHA